MADFEDREHDGDGGDGGDVWSADAEDVSAEKEERGFPLTLPAVVGFTCCVSLSRSPATRVRLRLLFSQPRRLLLPARLFVCPPV